MKICFESIMFALPPGLQRLLALGVMIMVWLMASQCAQDNVLAELDGTIRIDSISPAAGPVGTTVKIYGSGFSSTVNHNEVSINGIKASILEPASLTTLIIQVPPNSTTGKVSLKVDNVMTQGPVFTVVDPPIILSVTPLQGFAGYRVFINGSKLSQVSDVRFNGVAGGIFSKSSAEIVVITPNSTTGVIELLFPEGKVTGPVFTYLPIPVIDTAGIIQYIRLDAEGPLGSAIAFLGRHFATDAAKLKVYLNAQSVDILSAGLDNDGNPGVIIGMPPPETDNPTTLEIESEGIRSLPFEFVIPPKLNDLSYNYIGNTMRIRLDAYGSYFGVANPLKQVKVFQVGAVNIPVPLTVVSWTPTLITMELDIVHGEYYDVSVEVKEEISEVIRFRP